MLHTALKTVKNKLEQYLANRFGLDEHIVVLNQLVEHDGKSPQKNQNKMVITLINLDHETNKQYMSNMQRGVDNAYAKVNPSILFNMDLLFTAHFDDYEESLKFLNTTITFFQANNSLNHQNTPELPDDIKMLNFEVENSSYREIHNLWSAMGAKYKPSIIYKVRSIQIQANQTESRHAGVDQVSNGVTS